MEAMALPPKYMGNHDLVKAFLHSLYKKHLVIRKKYSEDRKKHGYQKVLNDRDMKITVNGTELFFLLPSKDEKTNNNTTDQQKKNEEDSMHFFRKLDYISYHLPPSLQPGYNRNDFSYECEDLYSPILPLLRSLGPAKTIRVLSALLCELRIIFVSKSIEMLSACVTACTAMLAQGLLVWRHVQIPVLPPHLLRYLATGAPFIVGVLDRFVDKIERMPKLKDAVYIDLDNGLLKTLHMTDAHKKVPDLLLKKKLKRGNAVVEELVNDFSSILQGERGVWVTVEAPPVEKEDDSKNGTSGKVTRRRSVMEKLGLAKPSEKVEDKNVLNTSQKKSSGGDFFTQAELFVKNFVTASMKKDPIEDDNEQKVVFSYADKAKSSRRHRAYILSDNERGEEVARASLVCFFLELFGDMGMYLSVDHASGSFRLDAKKFLLRKRQMGAKEDTPMFLLLNSLTRSVMFERFIEGRIADVEPKPKLHPVMICHTPLFQLCQQHMRRQKAKFVISNIRKVVFTTISACFERRLIDSREEVRERALALTSEKPFEGDEVLALRTLMDICKGCDLSFSQVMQVIWLRTGEDRPTLWKRPLLGLHLLRNFLLHGVSFIICCNKSLFQFCFSSLLTLMYILIPA